VDVPLADPHPIFVPPENRDAHIWRYHDLGKLLSLFDRSALFFPRLDKLEDPFEGYYTKSILALENSKLEDLPAELRAQIPDENALHNAALFHRQIRQFAKEQREITFVNSWYCSEYESAAMWSLYLKTREGIAIRSSYNRLMESLSGYEDFNVHIGMVKYIDYDRDSIESGNRNVLAPLMHKRKSFEHEKELRAVIWTVEHAKNEFGSGNKFKDTPGLYVKVHIPTLVDRVYVAPTAPTWIRELIESLLRRFGYTIPVVQSSLSEAAFY
jgi:hypothetical protein